MRPLAQTALLAAGLLLPGNASAEEKEYGPGMDTLKFELGAYFPAIDTKLQVSGVDLGDDLDLENNLGFSDNDTIFRVDGYWRFFKRHRLGFGYYQLNRDASRRLDETIEIGDKVFDIGLQLDSELNMTFYTIDYIYSFYQGDKWEISGLLGAYWVDFEFSAAGYAMVNDEQVLQQTENTDFSGPLPFVGLSFEYYITPKWLLIAKGGYFQLSVQDIDGKLLNLGAKLEYQLTRNVGLGLGYDYFRIDATATDGTKEADLLYIYQGVQAFGILKF